MGFIDHPNDIYLPFFLLIIILMIHYIYYIINKPNKNQYFQSIRYDISKIIIYSSLLSILIFVPGYFITVHLGVSITSFILQYFYSNPFEYFVKQESIFQTSGSFVNFHILFNFTGLFVGSIQLLFIKRLTHFQHKILGSLYMICMFIGCISVLIFCKNHCYGKHIDNTFSVFTSFIFMALSVNIPSFIGYYKIYFNFKISHSEFMLKSFISAWGSFFLFRILILIFLPFAPHFYSAWMIIIFTSWLIPFYLLDIYLNFKRDSKQIN